MIDSQASGIVGKGTALLYPYGQVGTRRRAELGHGTVLPYRRNPTGALGRGVAPLPRNNLSRNRTLRIGTKSVIENLGF